jgi:Mn-dependent DtxR family transcriptional regulator
MNEKYLSTSAIARELKVTGKELFAIFQDYGLIRKTESGWELTQEGEKYGAKTRDSKQYGKYIVWPETIKQRLSVPDNAEVKVPVSSTTISKRFNVSSRQVNKILSELGLVSRDRKGWVLTDLGHNWGGQQFKHPQSGIPFVHWPESILENENFKGAFMQTAGIPEEPSPIQEDFRTKYKAEFRTKDGHYVRSKAEVMVDNWLYTEGFVHAYERKLPVEEDVYCDFYLPQGKVYIEYWGLENDPQYLERKKEKIGIYQKNNFQLIELNESDIQNLDDILPRKLLDFGMQTN